MAFTIFMCIYTSGHISDERCLEFAINTKAKYVGMIGSKKKVKEVRNRLQQKEIPVPKLDRIHAPVGLPIKAETPEEIAISILAEIIQVRRSP